MVNLFYLDKDPKLCAKYYCDKHVNKIMIEILQIFWATDIELRVIIIASLIFGIGLYFYELKKHLSKS